jgi:hypothetical protein
MGNLDSQDSPRLRLGGSHHFPLIVYYVLLRECHIQMTFCLGTPKCESWNSQTWDFDDFGSPITFSLDLQLIWGWKQCCSPHRELSKGMWHATYTQGIWVDYRLLVVGSQIGNLTPCPSFDHNLCFKCSNGSCEPILDIYVPRDFQWYKERLNQMSFDPYNWSLNIQESIVTRTPNMGVHLGVWGFIPSHPFTFLGAWNVTPGLPLGLHFCKPLPWSQAQG